MSMLRHFGSCYQDSTVCFVAFTAGYNGDRESDFSVNTIGHAVCLAVSHGFDWMPRKYTACWTTFPAGEELSRVQLDPSLITGERYLLVNIDTETLEYAIDGIQWNTLLTKKNTMCLILTFMGCVFDAFLGSSKRTWRGVESLSPYSWFIRASTHVMPRVQRTSPDHTSANMAWVSVKTAKSYPVLTRRAIVLGTHTCHFPRSMVVHVHPQTQQLPTCLQHNLTILIQNAMKNVSTSSKRNLLTCVDTIWPDAIRVETVGMGLHSARVTKILLESTVTSMKAVAKMCFPKILVVVAWGWFQLEI